MLLPEKYQEYMKDLLKDSYADYEKSLEEAVQGGFRLNGLKAAGIFDKPCFPDTTGVVPWCGQGYYCTQAVSKHPYYHAGAYYIQEPSAMAPAAALPVAPGDVVLDMCGAPGGKSTCLGAKLKGSGWLVANDVSASRAQALLKNIEQHGIRNAVVMSEESAAIAARLPAYFDHVLVDAPCSGEGMFRKDSRLARSWEERGSSYYIPLQEAILEAAYAALKPGGTLVYSTCTFNLEENEKQVLALLEKHPGCILEDTAGELGVDRGFPIENTGGFNLAMTARIWPHRHKGEGHFIARIIKEAQAEQPSAVSGWETRPGNLDNGAYGALMAFAEEIGWQCPDRALLHAIKDKVLLHPEHMPAVSGLRVLRTGLLLGSFQKGRFEPSQALAQALSAEEASRVIDFSGSGYDVVRFLKGETLSVQHANGYWLVAVDGMGIGFGKVDNGKLKNKRDPNWRWQ